MYEMHTMLVYHNKNFPIWIIRTLDIYLNYVRGEWFRKASLTKLNGISKFDVTHA